MQQQQCKLQIVFDIYKDHICTQWITFMCSGLYNCDCSMVILCANTIPKNRIYHIIGKVASMGASMTVEDLDWYFYLQLTYMCSMKYIERFKVGYLWCFHEYCHLYKWIVQVHINYVKTKKQKWTEQLQ